MPYDSAHHLVSLASCVFRYDPYPIAVVRPVFGAETYSRMLADWPPLDSFKHYAKWGGGNAVLRPKDMTKDFNFINRMTDFEEAEEIHQFDFMPNQCVVFVKTFNSPDSVPQMNSGHPDVYRKSITLVIAEA
jgi:hypothetical protein